MPIELSLSERVLLAPTGCGVYLWFENEGAAKPLYVGKAQNLRSRLKQYLASDDLKTTFLMRRARHIEWIATENETEALLLENNLIKKHKPLYNVRLKDDKQYPYICISTSEPFPRIYLTRRRVPGNLYFGPFSKVQVARDKIQLALDLFPLRRRPLKLPLAKPAKPCLNYHLKKCMAPCAWKISEEDYAKIVKDVIAFISGKNGEARRFIEKRMHTLSQEMRFEEAAKLRDMLAYFNERNVLPQVEMRKSVLDCDIVGVFSAPLSHLREELSLREEDLPLSRDKDSQRDVRLAQICLLKFREAKLVAKENFALTETDLRSNDFTDTDFVAAFFRDYYLNLQDIPRFIVVPQSMELSFWQTALRENSQSNLTILDLEAFARKIKKSDTEINPQALMQMAVTNARLTLRERLLAETLRNQRVGLKQIQKFLGLKAPPATIECYDISNIQGTDPVASGVMLKDGVPYKPGYRKYQIKTVEGANDPAMMHEVITRRLMRIASGEVRAPDLIIVDGGITQLRAALRARGEVMAVNAKVRKSEGNEVPPQLHKIPMIGLAKQLEEIYTEDERILRFDKESPGMHILRRARDESHRFAVAYHRNRRMKRNLKSLFDGIEGVGEKKRAKALLLLRKLDLADMESEKLLDRIAKDVGVSHETAKKIVDKLQSSAV